MDLKGQTAVVFGLANKRSIAWAIAQKLSAAGARIAICYQNERLRRKPKRWPGSCRMRPSSSAMSPATKRSTRSLRN